MHKAKKMVYDVWDDCSTGVAILLSILIILGALAYVFGMMCLQTWLVMVLWNWVAVQLFGAPALTFWVAFGLRWLCALLFKTHVTVNKEK